MKTIQLIAAFFAFISFNSLLIANPVSNTLTMKIERLIAKSKDACNGKMDFYTYAKMNNRDLGKKGIKEGNDIRPNWSYRTNVAPQSKVRVVLAVWDEDDTWCGGGDDRVDITNYLSEKLKLTVDTKTKKIYDEKNKYVGRIGQAISFKGSSYSNSPQSGDNIETGIVTIRFSLREAAVTKKMSVVINSLRARSTDSCNRKMDFYSKIKINNNREKQSRVKEGNYIRPNWTGYSTVNANSLVRVRVQIWDEDDAVCGGGDDKVDVNPSNDNFLYLFVDVRTGKIYGDSAKRKYIGRVNQKIKTEGNAYRTYSALNLKAKNIEAATMEYTVYLR